MICQMVIDAFGYETHFIRQALIGLPAFFAEGWMVSHIVRFAIYGQRWPYQPQNGTLGPGDLAVLQDKARGILAGTAMFVSIRFLALGLFAVIYYMASGSPDQPQAAADKAASPEQPFSTGPEGFIGALLLLAASLWAFRLLWIYIPAAAGVPVGAFLNRIRGMGISFSLLGVTLVGFLPLSFLFVIVAATIARPFGGDDHALPYAVETLLGLGWVMTDTAISIVLTFALTWGLARFMFEPVRRP